ncbi:MAG: hypothetical protein Q7R72_01400 [bacterium]|nr:hypothetical protein [bacterium]
MKTYRLIIALGLIAVASINAQTTVLPPQTIVLPQTVPPVPTVTPPVTIEIAPVVNPAPIPPEILALASETDLAAFLAITAKNITIYVTSQAEFGFSMPIEVKITGPATELAISAAINAAKSQIKVSNTKTYVQYTVNVYSSDYSIGMTGADSKKPVLVGGVYELPEFSIELRLNEYVFIQARNLERVRLLRLDSDGSIMDSKYLETGRTGFVFPSRAAGKVMLETTDLDGVTVVYDLRNGVRATIETLSATAKVGKANTESMIDKSEINLIPFTYDDGYGNSVGQNVLGEIKLTKVTSVSVAGMTNQKAKATGFKYRQISPVLNEVWTVVKASSNGIAILPNLAVGDWQVIGIWDSKDLKESVYYIPDEKRGYPYTDNDGGKG